MSTQGRREQKTSCDSRSNVKKIIIKTKKYTRYCCSQPSGPCGSLTAKIRCLQLFWRCAPSLPQSYVCLVYAYFCLCLPDREACCFSLTLTLAPNRTHRTQKNHIFRCTGVSGPAALKLSAFGARVLNEGGYRGKLVVNWLAGNNPSRASASRGGPHF